MSFTLVTLLFLSFSTTFLAQALVPQNETFKFVNSGELGPYIVEYGGDYRMISIFNAPFQVGFYNTTPNSYTLALRIGLQRSEQLFRWVWEANRGNPVDENATFSLTTNGNLELANSNGRIVWQTNTSNKGVVAFRLLSNGNMVLINAKGQFIWQSFDHPTDTLLVDQYLRPNGPSRLVSRLSEKQNLDGPYSLVLEPKGLVLYYKSKNSPKPIPYWLSPNQGSLENVTLTSDSESFEIRFDTFLGRPVSNSTLTYLRLGIDGNIKFQTYFLDVRSGKISIPTKKYYHYQELLNRFTIHSNMSTTTTADPTPLIGTSSDDSNSGRRILRAPSLRQAARFLRQASGRRLMREPSMMVRETAAEQLEERQSDWAYSKPVVILDILWNLSFIIVAATVMILSRSESPSTPLRLWILGYVLQCAVHTVCVCFEYRRRIRMREQGGTNGGNAVGSGGSGDLSFGSMDGSGQFGDDGSTSLPKHLESANTMFSFIWWVIGFYWVSADGQDLITDSPMLYWLCIVFLGFDVFFVVFCIALACIIGLAVCCCLPCIIALLYAVADQEGATKEDIEQLSKFKFQRKSKEKLAGNTQGPVGGIMTECGADSPIEHVLADEDAECCICLSAYEDDVELRQLPCGHHFHCSCVDKWLHINATCPLCKYDILKSSNYGQEEV